MHHISPTVHGENSNQKKSIVFSERAICLGEYLLLGQVGANKFPPACLAGTGHPLECSAHWCPHLRTIRATEKPLESMNSGRMHQTLEHPHIAGLAHGTFQQKHQALYSTSHQQPWNSHRPTVGSVEFSRRNVNCETKAIRPTIASQLHCQMLRVTMPQKVCLKGWKTNKSYVCLIRRQVPSTIQTFHGSL